MGDIQLTITSALKEGYYRITYRCTNCGTIFEADIRKGTEAAKADSICPYCDTRSNKTKGFFQVIKHNSELDKPLTKYY